MDAFSPAHYLARTRRADAVVYIDFDGVVQHHAVYCTPKRGIHLRAPGRSLFEWTPHLEELLRPYPEFKLVLSTSWARRPGFGKAKARLPSSLQARVIGSTFHRRVHGADAWVEQGFLLSPRGEQVLADVARRKPLVWCALDDDAEGWPVPYLRHLVQCDSELGLSCPATRERAAAKLAEMASELEALRRGAGQGA
ncbi:hypothetical protein JI746_21860 [Ramlibacter alkalitolerans]|uniref:FCP1 homology domain-containing protein n=2 Tax=Ramlibacter alkalitolerans TaxID=2039631 RepID=A0ABS1JU74_9BURK|nr:HAD domain-containing protein [Ramlibacter alkalitolerans]MBL0427768.1 hypothetical protein [Ramlibacter alkalitolerans]